MDRQVYEYISQQTNDPIIERKICTVSGKEFAIFQSDLDFYNKISPTFNNQKFQIPTPTLCPEERTKRRMLFKNDRFLFKRNCDLTQKPIISIHTPENEYTVYSVAARWSDGRNPMDYQQNRDNTSSFFSQYRQLHKKVPQIAMMNDNGISSENIEYCQDVAYAKDCYLTAVARKLEHAYYSNNMAWGKRLVDCFFTMESENCYECCDSNHLYGCFRLQYAYNCSNCRFWFDLAGCKDCIGCVNLREKQYCIFNKQYTKEQYEQYKTSFMHNLHKDFDATYKQFYDFMMQQPHRTTYNTNATNTYSSNLYGAEKSIMCFNIQNTKDTKYCMFWDGIRDAMDLTVWGEMQLCCECNTPDHSYKCFATILSRSCTNVMYSEMCHGCQNCFGCIGLRNKQYCILNKQYTPEEYEILVPQIIEKMQKDGERWEFFSKEISPFAYNAACTKDYFPLTKDEALAQGYKRLNEKEEINIPNNIQSVLAKDLPSNSDEIPDDIINKAIICEVSGRPFRVLKPELEFYKKWNIPFPHKHPDIRFEERFKRMPPKTLYLRNCDKTNNEILSVYPPNTPFPVYSEKAYNQEIYG